MLRPRAMGAPTPTASRCGSAVGYHHPQCSRAAGAASSSAPLAPVRCYVAATGSFSRVCRVGTAPRCCVRVRAEADAGKDEGGTNGGTARPSNGNGQAHRAESSRVAGDYGVPTYLQSAWENNELCDSWQALVNEVELELSDFSEGRAKTIWAAVRQEAQAAAADEPLLSSYLYASILGHKDLEHSLAFVLSNRLANNTLLPTQLFDLIMEVLKTHPEVRRGVIADLQAAKERDPACNMYSCALLYFKGYHALQAHRIAHALWLSNRKVMALAIQSRISEVFAVDVHPGAHIGCGVLMDHGTGVVIGETAVVGNNVSLLQGVTLGGTGKETGDRHPKVRDNVLIGAHATVLGNIEIGEGSQIASGSLVLKPVPAHTIMAGSPAQQVGEVEGNPARRMQHWLKDLQSVYEPKGKHEICDEINEKEEAVDPTKKISTSVISNVNPASDSISDGTSGYEYDI